MRSTLPRGLAPAASFAVHVAIVFALFTLHVPATARYVPEAIEVTLAPSPTPEREPALIVEAVARPPASEPAPVLSRRVSRPVHRAPPPIAAAPGSPELLTTQDSSAPASPAPSDTPPAPAPTAPSGEGLASGTAEGASHARDDHYTPRIFDGMWLGIMYFPSRHHWARVELTITQREDRLVGWIDYLGWEGGATDRLPQGCVVRVVMPAQGITRGRAFAFDAQSYRYRSEHCGHSSYDPDRFVGSLASDGRLDTHWFDDGMLRAGQHIHFTRGL